MGDPGLLPPLSLDALSSRGPSPATLPPGALTEARDPAPLHQAYRLDLANMELRPPVFLNGDGALLIATDLQVGATILAVVPGDTHQGKPILGVAARIPGASGPHLLLCKDAHFSLLLPVEGPPERIGYYLSEGGTFTGCMEVAVATGEGSGTVLRRVPADGNCLITSLFFIKQGRFPEPHETARLRRLVAFNLNDEQVADALGAMRSDLIGNAVERPFEGGAFTGYGPLASAMLRETDPDFMTRRDQNLEVHRKQAAQVEAAGRAFLARREAAEREAAMARLDKETKEVKAWLGSTDPGRSGDPASAERALVEAYRNDLRDPESPMLLDLEEAQILANFLEIRAEIHQVVPAKASAMRLLEIRKRAVLNEGLAEGPATQVLLAHHRHFSVLGVNGQMEGATHIGHAPDGTPTFYAETGERTSESAGPVPVPADGNCLLTALFFLATDSFPGPKEIAGMRQLIAAGMTDNQVRKALLDLRADLIHHAGERPFEGGRYAGCGPRVSELLNTDSAFLAERGKVLGVLRTGYERVGHSFQPAPSPGNEEWDPELEAALAMSLGESAEETGSSGTHDPAWVPSETKDPRA